MRESRNYPRVECLSSYHLKARLTHNEDSEKKASKTQMTKGISCKTGRPIQGRGGHRERKMNFGTGQKGDAG